MSFESGSISFRVFGTARPLPDDTIEQLAEHALAHIDSAGDSTTVFGWVTGRHLLDADLREETVMHGGWLRVALVQVEKKIPSTLMQAEMKREELVRCLADDKPFVSRREKSEIKEQLTARLLPSMPPTMKGLPVLYRPGDTRFFAGALADKQSDTLILHMRHALGLAPRVMDPIVAAFERKQTDVQQWAPTSYSDKVSPEEVLHEAGADFLTWLWFRAETGNGYVVDGADTQWGVLIEGPLTFVREGQGAHETVLRRGVPTASPEAGACLRAGKKLTKAKITLSQGEQNVWPLQIDAVSFTFRSMKVPENEEEELDPISRFQDRMLKVEQVVDGWFALYDRFVDERRNARKWNEVSNEMREWAERNRGGA